ncbi:MAG TPA: Hsp33 family molecular chaperone HslO, partial [Burkholderiaceae bacterium]
PYQGVVPLYGDRREKLGSLSDALAHYMLQSEQLDTTLVLAANGEVATGLLVQRMPAQGKGNLSAGQQSNEDGIGLSEDYNRIATLAASLTREELLTLDVDTILHRLFWKEHLLRFAPAPGTTARSPHFACTCSRDRVGNMLRSLGTDEVDSILAEQGQVEVGCEFCGRQYRFDAVDAAQIFTTPTRLPPGSATVQ